MKDKTKTARKAKKSRKKKKKVRISPKHTNQVFFADEYDRTPPELNVFHCDECGTYILKERHHCTKCDEFDLCPKCFVGADLKHEHGMDDFETIPPDKEEDEKKV